MQRFFIDPLLLQSPQVDLPAPIARQLAQVLRARVGERIILLDNTGWEYEAELLEVSGRRVSAAIRVKINPRREPVVSITLYQAPVRETKFDWVLQKGTEIGITRYIPVISERSASGMPTQAKYERWRRIITEAAEQAGRTRLPQLEPAVSFCTACDMPSGLRLIAAPQGSHPLKQALPSVMPHELGLFIGPEGGFSEGEVQYAVAKGIIPVSLGPFILRTETAGLAAAAMVLYHYGIE